VADFARRRLGEEVLAAMVGPIVSGVYAGDPERLSLPLAFPRIAAMEREHGSLLRAARRVRSGIDGRRTVITLRDGLESLPRRLAEACGPVRTGTPCLGIRAEPGLFTLSTPAGEVAARRLVLATPAASTGQLLETATAGRSATLCEVPYASAAVVAFGFQRLQVQHPLDGFGFLAARGAGLRVLGCVFASTVFPERAPAGHVVLTAILGGELDREISGWDDSHVQETALADLRRALGIAGEPVIAAIGRWPRAIPQPELGHRRFLDLAAELEQRLPGLVIAGSFLGGVAVGDCVERGVRAAIG
jgi:oxygen-dependent protoporphyrinogen oxidase